jgi:hypothetical protein
MCFWYHRETAKTEQPSCCFTMLGRVSKPRTIPAAACLLSDNATPTLAKSKQSQHSWEWCQTVPAVAAKWRNRTNSRQQVRAGHDVPTAARGHRRRRHVRGASVLYWMYRIWLLCCRLCDLVRVPFRQHPKQTGVCRDGGPPHWGRCRHYVSLCRLSMSTSLLVVDVHVTAYCRCPRHCLLSMPARRCAFS